MCVRVLLLCTYNIQQNTHTLVYCVPHTTVLLTHYIADYKMAALALVAADLVETYLLDVPDPISDVVKALFACDIIHQHDPLGNTYTQHTHTHTHTHTIQKLISRHTHMHTHKVTMAPR